MDLVSQVHACWIPCPLEWTPERVPAEPRPTLGCPHLAPEGKGRKEEEARHLLQACPFYETLPTLFMSKFHFFCEVMVTVDSSCYCVFVFNVLTWQNIKLAHYGRN